MSDAVARARVLEMTGRFRTAALVQQAFEHGVFETLDAPKTSAEVAQPRGWSTRRTQVVLDALVALGLLVRADEVYVNSPDGQRFLQSNGAEYVGDMVLHERLQQPLWSDLRRVFANDNPLPDQQDVTIPTDARRNAVLLRAMRQVAGELPRRVAALPEWSGCRRVLDVAGGHGLYLVALARAHPTLSGVVLDLPVSRAEAEASFAAAGLTDRLRFVPGDLTTPEVFIDQPADGMLFCRCLHNFPPKTIRAVLARAHDRLVPGGVLVVVEHLLEEDAPHPVWSAVFGAYMAVNCAGGWLPPREWLRRELEVLGFSVREEVFDDINVALVARRGG